MVRVSDVKVHAKVIVHAKIKGYIHGHGDVEFLFFNIFYNYILKTCFFSSLMMTFSNLETWENSNC